MSKFSVSAAHRITGKSRTTITKHINSGKLSCSVDGQGNKQIDAAELLRVYGDECNFEIEQNDNQKPKAEPEPKTNKADGLLLERLEQERKRERQQYEDQIEHLKQALKTAQEGHNRATLLLENHSKAPKQELIALEQRLMASEKKMDQNTQRIKQRAKKVIKKYKQALEMEKQKTFWDKLIGK